MIHSQPSTNEEWSQVLRDAAEVDAKHTHGEDVGPLCGLAFGVKDNIDVLGMPTVAGTPALEGRLHFLARSDHRGLLPYKITWRYVT